MAHGARSLSLILTEILQWVQATQSEISNATYQSYYPGRISGHICMLHNYNYDCQSLRTTMDTHFDFPRN